MTWVGDAGLVLLGMAVIAVLAGLVAVLPAALRVRRASLETQRLVELYRLTVSVAMEKSDELDAEREILMRPFRSLRRVVAHPLVIALFDSYRLRRRRAREAAPL